MPDGFDAEKMDLSILLQTELPGAEPDLAGILTIDLLSAIIQELRYNTADISRKYVTQKGSETNGRS